MLQFVGKVGVWVGLGVGAGVMRGWGARVVGRNVVRGLGVVVSLPVLGPKKLH